MHHHDKKEIWRRSERWLIAQTLFILPLSALLLKIFGFKRSYVALGRLLSFADSFRSSPEQKLSEAQRIAKIVSTVNHLHSPYIFSCLPESFTLCYLLRRRKIAAELCIGVRTTTGPFESHAWVEYNYVVLNDIENIADIYAPFNLGAIIIG